MLFLLMLINAVSPNVNVCHYVKSFLVILGVIICILIQLAFVCIYVDVFCEHKMCLFLVTFILFSLFMELLQKQQCTQLY